MQDFATPDLYLHEEVLLLALNDDRGTVGGMYHLAVGGAILAELMMGEHIYVEGKNNLVTCNHRKRISDPILRECRDAIHGAKRRSPLTQLVTKFATLRDLKHRIAQRLCDRGILRADEDRVLWVFKRKIYPECNPKPERQLIARLRRAIFTETKNITPRTVVLLSLAEKAHLLPLAFDKKKLQARKKRIEQVVAGEVIGKSTKQAMAAAQSTLIASTVMTTMIMPTMISP